MGEFSGISMYVLLLYCVHGADGPARRAQLSSRGQFEEEFCEFVCSSRQFRNRALL